jgi:Pyruvate/2-oxoacid:ferredoxin oxidoreductase delta subunit
VHGLPFVREVLPAGIVTVKKAKEKGGRHEVTFDWNYCKGCGLCMTSCARNCIEMQPERDFV